MACQNVKALLCHTILSVLLTDDSEMSLEKLDGPNLFCHNFAQKQAFFPETFVEERFE